MITPMSNYNVNSLQSMNKSNNTSLSINSLDPQQQTNETNSELKKNNPAFKGVWDREATIILQNLSNGARTRLGSVEYMKSSGFSGKIFSFLFKILDSLAKYDKSGAVEFMGNDKANIQYQITEITVKKLLQEYLSKVMPDGNGGIELDLSKGSVVNDCVVGKGFKIYKNGNFELDQNLRKPIIDILENSKTYQEIKEKLSEVKPMQ